MSFRIGILVLGLILGVIVFNRVYIQEIVLPVPDDVWQIQAIDTMKFSRDLAREKGDDTSFEKTIQNQVRDVAKTGATHISIGTPYDEEFIPFLKKWVSASRKQGLHIWYRGNMSGWEGWFDYPLITREEHTVMIKAFIQNNSGLFEDGDLFSTCPECENGGPGDPRETGDVIGHRKFLIDEYRQTTELFKELGKDVQTNFNGMNYDVALLIMDTQTTQQLGNVIVIDHYVKTPEQTVADITALAKSTSGRIMLGEVGAPIPDIHGDMTEDEQNMWVEDLLSLLSQETSVIGVNYWTGNGASTEIWNANGTPRKAVEAIKTYFTANHTSR